MHDKKKLSERDICTQYITPALQRAGWDFATQVREEVSFTKGRVIVRGKLHTRGKQKRADYVLYYAPNLPIAVIEANDNTHTVGDGMQQGLNYAETLEVPFAISSNGDAFLIHDRTGRHTPHRAANRAGSLPHAGRTLATLLRLEGNCRPRKARHGRNPFPRTVFAECRLVLTYEV